MNPKNRHTDRPIRPMRTSDAYIAPCFPEVYKVGPGIKSETINPKPYVNPSHHLLCDPDRPALNRAQAPFQANPRQHNLISTWLADDLLKALLSVNMVISLDRRTPMLI